jgi:hypothetical protein
MDAQAVADWMRAEAATARADLAYAIRQLAVHGCIERALDALERVGAALEAIERGGDAGGDGE